MELTYVPEGVTLTTIRNRELTSTLAGLEKAMETGAIIEGTAVLCDGDFNLHVDFPTLGGVRGIIPREEVVWSRGGEPPKDIAILTRVGKNAVKVFAAFVDNGGKANDLRARANDDQEL